MANPVTLLEIYRREKGLGQWDLARATGIVQSRISLIERGHIKPREDEKRAIAGVLGIPIEELFSLSEDLRGHTQ